MYFGHGVPLCLLLSWLAVKMAAAGFWTWHSGSSWVTPQTFRAWASFQSFQETRVTSCYLRFPWIVSFDSAGCWGRHGLWVPSSGSHPRRSASSGGGRQHPALGGRQRQASSSDGMRCLQGELPHDELAAGFECLRSAVKRLCCCFDWRGSEDRKGVFIWGLRFKATFREWDHLWILYWMALSPYLSNKDN